MIYLLVDRVELPFNNRNERIKADNFAISVRPPYWPRGIGRFIQPGNRARDDMTFRRLVYFFWYTLFS